MSNFNVYPNPSWLEAQESPFGLACMDIRALTRNMQTSTDEQTYQIFRRLRESTGIEHVKECNSWGGFDSWQDSKLVYPTIPDLGYGSLFTAERLEDKWDIYFHAGDPEEETSVESLYFCRSWSGEVLFRGLLETYPGEYCIFGIQINPQKAQKITLVEAQAYIDFLMKSHIFGLEAPAPLPPSSFSGGKAITIEMEEVDMIAPPEQVAKAAFANYGWRAGFATPFNPTLFPFDFENAEKLK